MLVLIVGAGRVGSSVARAALAAGRARLLLIAGDAAPGAAASLTARAAAVPYGDGDPLTARIAADGTSVNAAITPTVRRPRPEQRLTTYRR